MKKVFCMMKSPTRIRKARTNLKIKKRRRKIIRIKRRKRRARIARIFILIINPRTALSPTRSYVENGKIFLKKPLFLIRSQIINRRIRTRRKRRMTTTRRIIKIVNTQRIRIIFIFI